MSSDPTGDLPPLDPELGALFKAERGNAKAPPGAKAKSWAKLEAELPPPGGGGPSGSSPAPAAPAATGGIIKLLGALAIGAVLGGGAVAALRPPQVVYVERPSPMVASALPTAAPSDSASVSLLTVVRAPEPEASIPVAIPTPAPSASSNLPAERALLDEGRTALGRGDGQHALEATARHAREFPRGQLTEEREAIAIQALAKLKRCDVTTARGNLFNKRYPNSVLGPVVDAALDVCGNLKPMGAPSGQ